MSDASPDSIDVETLAQAYTTVAPASAFYGLTDKEFAADLAAEYDRIRQERA